MIKITLYDKIEKLNISNRLHNSLRREGIDTVEKLLDFPEDKWNEVRNLGAKSIAEVLALTDSIRKMNGEYELVDEATAIENIEDNIGDAFEKSIDEMDFSKRAYNCLSRAGITNMSQIVVMTEDELLKIKNMGIGTVNEILSKIALLEEKIKNYTTCQGDIPEEILVIADECAEFYDLSAFKMRNLFASVYEEDESSYMQTIIQKAYTDPYLKTGIKNNIMNVCKKLGDEFDAESVKVKLPSHLLSTAIVEDCLVELEDDGQLESENNVYKVCYPRVMEYLEALTNEHHKIVTMARLQGRTLEDVGNKLGLTRERTRQICAKVFNSKQTIHFEEDKYRYIFENYSLACEDFCKITNEPETTFYYLDMVCDIRGKERATAEKMLADEHLSLEIKRRAERVVYKNYIILDGARIRKNKSDLFKYVVKKYCREKTSYSDVLKYYYELLDEKGLSDNPKLEIDVRSYSNKLQACDYVLWNRNQTLRYYNITEKDYTRLLSKLNLEQYENITFSSLKLYREHYDVMDEYDIRDEYELHNLLKKIWDDWGKCDVVFSKMPTINIGNIDRDSQVIEVLLKYAPISNIDLAKKYEDTYGVLTPTVLANYFGCIDSYFHNGMYSVEFEAFTTEQSDRMTEILTEDFYSLDDFIRIMKREFPNAEDSLINSYNIKNLGFIFNDHYLIKKKFISASEYFRFKLLEKEIVDTREFPIAMQNSVSFTTEKYDLRSKRIITEFSPGQYINISRLNEAGITEEVLKKYCEEVESFVPKNIFFTIKSIKADGFDSQLHELYFDDWFYSSVLAEDKENFNYIRCGSTRLFYSCKEKFSLSDFITWIVERETKIDIYDLEELCRDRYGVFIDKYKLISLANNAGLYYDEIMETVYIDYDTYFEEV